MTRSAARPRQQDARGKDRVKLLFPQSKTYGIPTQYYRPDSYADGLFRDYAALCNTADKNGLLDQLWETGQQYLLKACQDNGMFTRTTISKAKKRISEWINKQESETSPSMDNEPLGEEDELALSCSSRSPTPFDNAIANTSPSSQAPVNIPIDPRICDPQSSPVDDRKWRARSTPANLERETASNPPPLDRRLAALRASLSSKGLITSSPLLNELQRAGKKRCSSDAGLCFPDTPSKVAKAEDGLFQRLRRENPEWLTGDDINFILQPLEEHKTQIFWLGSGYNPDQIALKPNTTTVILPLEIENHWISLLLDLTTKKCYLSDSLPNGANQRRQKALRFIDELKEKSLLAKDIEFDLQDDLGPAQANLDDCGVFTCAMIYLRLIQGSSDKPWKITAPIWRDLFLVFTTKENPKDEHNAENYEQLLLDVLKTRQSAHDRYTYALDIDQELKIAQNTFLGVRKRLENCSALYEERTKIVRNLEHTLHTIKDLGNAHNAETPGDAFPNQLLVEKGQAYIRVLEQEIQTRRTDLKSLGCRQTNVQESLTTIVKVLKRISLARDELQSLLAPLMLEKLKEEHNVESTLAEIAGREEDECTTELAKIQERIEAIRARRSQHTTRCQAIGDEMHKLYIESSISRRESLANKVDNDDGVLIIN